MVSLHQRRTHPVPVDGCWACRVGNGPNLSASATPTRAGSAYKAATAEEKRLTVDGDAYKRLRADGFQPKTINGSANLEANATTRFEIESGQVFTDKAQGKEALSFFSDTFGRDATTPATTPVPDDAA
jgi:hypothetical protein